MSDYIRKLSVTDGFIALSSVCFITNTAWESYSPLLQFVIYATVFSVVLLLGFKVILVLAEAFGNYVDPYSGR